MNILNYITNIFKYKYTFSEFFLNSFFICIISFVLFIIYWDTINRKVSNVSRCKDKIKFLSDKNKTKSVNVKDENNNDLYNISYNESTKDYSINCTCPTGNKLNVFQNINVYDINSDNVNKRTTKDKNCYCDNKYTYQKDKAIYTGNSTLVQFMGYNTPADFTRDLF